jgi:hypothetical protein
MLCDCTLSFLLVVSLSVKADFFGDIGDWFEGAWNDTGDYISHNPGISILSGLAIVSVTEPLALRKYLTYEILYFILNIHDIFGRTINPPCGVIIYKGRCCRNSCHW